MSEKRDVARILFIQHHTGIGGATASLLGLIEHLDCSRYEPSVLFTGYPGPAVDRARELGAKVFQLDGVITYGHGNGARPKFSNFPPWLPISRLFQVYPSARRVAGFLKQHKFDLIYLNTSILLPAAWGCIMTGHRPVMHVREMLYWGHFGLRFRFVRNLIEHWARQIVVLSHASKRQFTGRTPVTVLYNALDFSIFRRDIDKVEARWALSLPGNDHIVLMMGGFLPHKGSDVFIKAAEKIVKTNPDVYFVLLGHTGKSGDECTRGVKRWIKRLAGADPAGALRRKVIRLKLQKRLIMPGPQNNVYEWLAASDLCVFPAREDHFARPVIEAAAMGLPSIASDGPTARELVLHGKTGLLVPPGQPDSLADAISELLANDNRRLTMGEAAYKLALERYDIKDQIKRFHDIIEQVLTDNI